MTFPTLDFVRADRFFARARGVFCARSSAKRRAACLHGAHFLRISSLKILARGYKKLHAGYKILHGGYIILRARGPFLRAHSSLKVKKGRAQDEKYKILHAGYIILRAQNEKYKILHAAFFLRSKEECARKAPCIKGQNLYWRNFFMV